MKPGMVHIDNSYVAAEHGFATMRKSVWIAESSVRNPVAGIEIVEPQPFDPDDVARVRDSS